MNYLRLLPPSAIACVLSACGGGGGGAANPPANPPPNPPANTAPTITTTTLNAVEDTNLVVTLTATDAQAQVITFTLVTPPAHGTATGFSGAGQFTYLGAPDFNGADTLTVRATDSAGAETTATVTITVAARDDAPTIRADVITASGNMPLIDVLANDSEPDGETLTLTLVGAPDFGTAAIENGKVRLTLPAGFQGFNTFTYSALDAAGGGTTARVAVFIDTAPVRFVYVTNEEDATVRNLYSDDLISRKRLTSYDANSAIGIGLWVEASDNGRTILYEAIDNSVANGRFLAAVPADGSRGPRRLNPPLTAGQTLKRASALSPDGRWATYSIREANSFVDRFYLVDVTGDAAPREIVAPPGALAIEAPGQELIFDGQSQYLFMGVRMQINPTDHGMTIYRVPVANPAAPEPFFPAAVSSSETLPVFASPDGSRAVIIGTDQAGTRLWLSSAASPATPQAVSPLLTSTMTMGSWRVDWGRNRLLFSIDTLPTVNPFVSVLHMADLATGTWTVLGNLPAERSRPEFIDIHPSGSPVLFSSFVTDPNTGGGEAIQEVDLVAGTPTRVLETSNYGHKIAQFVNDGTAVLYATGGTIAAIPRNDPTHPKMLFNQAHVVNYSFSQDGKILSVAAGVDSQIDSDSLWAVNQTTAPGTFAKPLLQISQQRFTYVSAAEIVPRY